MLIKFQEFSEAQWTQFKREAEQVKDFVGSKVFIHIPNSSQGNYLFWTGTLFPGGCFTHPDLTQLWISSSINIPTKNQAEGNISVSFRIKGSDSVLHLFIFADQRPAHWPLRYSSALLHYSGATERRPHYYFHTTFPCQDLLLFLLGSLKCSHLMCWWHHT